MLQRQFGSRHIHPRPLLLALLILIGFGAQGKMAYAEDRQQIIVAGGCFWCVEKDFEQVKGVIEAESERDVHLRLRWGPNWRSAERP